EAGRSPRGGEGCGEGEQEGRQAGREGGHGRGRARRGRSRRRRGRSRRGRPGRARRGRRGGEEGGLSLLSAARAPLVTQGPGPHGPGPCVVRGAQPAHHVVTARPVAPTGGTRMLGGWG